MGTHFLSVWVAVWVAVVVVVMGVAVGVVAAVGLNEDSLQKSLNPYYSHISYCSIIPISFCACQLYENNVLCGDKYKIVTISMLLLPNIVRCCAYNLS